jgi:hypothetical protein
MAWKCANKNILHLIRGNHEIRQINMIYGFKGEIDTKYNND